MSIGQAASGTRHVATAADLAEAAGDPKLRVIAVTGALRDLPVLKLRPGQSLVGEGKDASLAFAPGSDGVQLSIDNRVADLGIAVDPERRAIYNDTDALGFGHVELTNLSLMGNLRLLLAGQARAGHVSAHDIRVVSADARSFPDRPAGFGVEVVPGAFTIWNMQPDPACRLTADLTGISAGTPEAPVRGSGIFVGGTPGGGQIFVRRLATGEVHSDGGISPGTPDRISGGVFTLHGAWVDEVHNMGSVTTYGPNDMVLDNWGTVERWQADAKITSYGPSGIGFVNFGDVGVLRVDGIIETFGLGARGFNVYAGTVRDAEFERVVTRADGAVGVQISQPVGRIAVRNGIETYGAIGTSLVKGVMMQLPATALSIKPGGRAREITVKGGLVSHGKGIEPLELHGTIDEFIVSGSFGPHGEGFDAL